MKARIVVVSNPISGGGRGALLLQGLKSGVDAVKALAVECNAGAPDSWDHLVTTADGSWRGRLVELIEPGNVAAVIVIGGDGTVAETAATLFEYKINRKVAPPTLVAVPAGRGNDFARTLYGYTLEDGDFWAWCARQAGERSFGGTPTKMRWQLQPLDLASCNGRVFANMASVGYGGRVVENTHNRKAFWSKSSLVYQIEGAFAMFDGPKTSCEIKVDGQTAFNGDFFGAFVGNGKTNGAGLYWTPAAVLDDGRIDAIAFAKPSIFQFARSLNAIKGKRPPPFRHTYCQGAEISFHFDRPTALELDGDFVGNAMSHGFKCLPRALNSWVLKK